MNEKFDFIGETRLFEKIKNGLPEDFINRMNGLLEEEADAFFSSYEKPDVLEAHAPPGHPV